MPAFLAEDVAALAEKSITQCIADTLNRLFDMRLTGWDVEFCIGRNSIRTVSLGHKQIAAECWHNADGNFSRTITDLKKLCAQTEADYCGGWAEIAIRIAVLTGIIGEALRSGEVSMLHPMDIAVAGGEFYGPVSAWLARSWGLPVGNIVYCCSEDHAVWELLHHGCMRTDAVSGSSYAMGADVCIPRALEYLITFCAGQEECLRYIECCRKGALYTPEEPVREKLRQGFEVCVVSEERVSSAIWGIYRSRGNLISADTALAHAGQQDFRSRVSALGYCVIFSENSPECDREFVMNAAQISKNIFDNEMRKG